MLESIGKFLRGREPQKEADVANDRPNEANEADAAGVTAAEPRSELLSLLEAVNEQCLTLQIEHTRAASESKRELETLTARMTTLVPQFVKAVEAQAEGEKLVGRLSRSEIELLRKLDDAKGEIDHYRPLALNLEDTLLTEQKRSAEGARDFAALEVKHAKTERRLELVVSHLTLAETEMQRTAESNAAFATKAHEHDFAMEGAMREIAQINSDLVARTSEAERQSVEITDLAVRLTAERDSAVRAQSALTSLQADYDRFKRANKSAIKDFEVRDLRVNELIAQRDWQIFDYETRYAAQQSRIEFLVKKNESQRGDILRHIDHIGKLESSNRNLLDSSSRSAISIDDTAPDAERGKISAPKLRAIKDD